MAKILVVCDHGNNRSVHVAHRLKYLNHDVLTAGLTTNTEQTLRMLFSWAEIIVTTSEDQYIPFTYHQKMRCWNIGPDIYPRPMNHELDVLAKDFIKNNLIL